MENLVMEILTVSRMKSSGFSLQPEAIRLTDFAAGILDSHGELLNEKGIDVAVTRSSFRRINGFLPRYSAISSAMPAITPRPGKRSAFRSPKLMTLWDFPLKIQESIFLRRRFRDCLNHLQGGSRHVTGRQAEAVWGFLLCGWCWSCIIFLTGWKIQTTASDLVLYLPCREICVICRCFNLSLLDKTIPISYYTIN